MVTSVILGIKIAVAKSPATEHKPNLETTIMYGYTNPYLTQIATVIIPATDGTPTLASTLKADRLFLGHGCKKLGDYISPPTKQRAVEFPLLTKRGKFTKIYGGFEAGGAKVGLEKLSITPAQFCVGKEFFQDKDIVLIRVESKNKVLFFVADVLVHYDGSLYVFVDKFSRDSICDVKSQRRVLVPKPDPPILLTFGP